MKSQNFSCGNAVPTQFLMWERRSHAFPPHYTTGFTPVNEVCIVAFPVDYTSSVDFYLPMYSHVTVMLSTYHLIVSANCFLIFVHK